MNDFARYARLIKGDIDKELYNKQRLIDEMINRGVLEMDIEQVSLRIRERTDNLLSIQFGIPGFDYDPRG